MLPGILTAGGWHTSNATDSVAVLHLAGHERAQPLSEKVLVRGCPTCGTTRTAFELGALTRSARQLLEELTADIGSDLAEFDDEYAQRSLAGTRLRSDPAWNGTVAGLSRDLARSSVVRDADSSISLLVAQVLMGHVSEVFTRPPFKRDTGPTLTLVRATYDTPPSVVLDHVPLLSTGEHHLVPLAAGDLELLGTAKTRHHWVTSLPYDEIIAPGVRDLWPLAVEMLYSSDITLDEALSAAFQL